MNTGRYPQCIFLKIILICLPCCNLFPAYKNIIFDFGGVILSGGPKHAGTLSSSPAFLAWMKGQKTLEGTRRELSISHDAVAVDKMFTKILSLDRQWIDETITVIQTLKMNGYQIYVLSNLAQEVRNKFSFHPIFSCFDGMLYSYEVGYTKPDTRIYFLLLEKYNLSPSESIFIDDALQNILAAQEAGITGILYSSGNLACALTTLGIRL